MIAAFLASIIAGRGGSRGLGIRSSQTLLPSRLSAFSSINTASISPASFRERSSVPLLHAQDDDRADEAPGRRPTKNDNDDVGVDFSWDGGTIAVVLGALIAMQFFVLANI
jgi:hypothetical protein